MKNSWSNISKSTHYLYQCLKCGKGKGLGCYPRGDATICKACLRKSKKIERKNGKFGQKVSVQKVGFAKHLRKHMTEAETHLWAKLSALAPVFSCQTIVYGYIADFACVSRKLIIEIDGEYHNDISHASRDRERDDNLMRRGFRTLRFTNEEVFSNRSSVLGKIVETL